MKNIRLLRIAYLPDVTLGVLFDENLPFALTLERCWLDNKKSISCIPNGTYICQRVVSPKFGNTFEVKDVPERSHILFHKGNISDDSRGCVIVGEQFEPVNGKPGVLASAKGFNEFLARTKEMNEFLFTVKKNTITL